VQLSGCERISIQSDGDNYSLTISDAQSSDSGEYKITASSTGGRLSCTASLLVTGTDNCSICGRPVLINRTKDLARPSSRLFVPYRCS